MLSERERSLYGRQALLVEIGAAGQRKLCDTRLRGVGDRQGNAAAVTLDYIARAGCGVVGEEDDSACPSLNLPTTGDVERVAGAAHLREAAAALLGAFAAVEAVKEITGAGDPSEFPKDFVLCSEETD